MFSSPYSAALDASFESLAPALHTYFGEILPWQVGIGHGVFDVAGSRVRAAWPILLLLAHRRVLFPERGSGIPFTVRNVTDAAGRRTSAREVRFARRTRVMEDTTLSARGRIVDRIGLRRGLEVRFDAGVDDGGLRMVSTDLAWRVARRRIPLPRFAVVALDERALPSGRQRIDLRITMPLLGEVFAYRGEFAYALEPL